MEMLIGGTWQSAGSDRTEEVTAPFDGTVVAAGGFVNAGQVCISVQRVIAHPAIRGDFLDWESAIAQANGTPYGLGAGMRYRQGRPRSAVAETTDPKTVVLPGRPWQRPVWKRKDQR